MVIPQENGPTYVLRRICDKIQAKTVELLTSFTNSQLQKHKNLQNKNGPDYEQTRICNRTLSTQKSNFTTEQSLVEAIKNELCRMISSELPTVVNYETKINDRIEDLEQQLQECKKLAKIEKINYKDSILERDNLKVQILSKEHQNQQLTDQLDAFKQKYNEAVVLVSSYIKEIQQHQTTIQQFQIQNNQLNEEINRIQEINFNHDHHLNQFDSAPFPTSPKLSTLYLTSPKQTSKQINYPLQMRQQLTEAQKVLNRSPRSNHPQLQFSHFQLSSQIVGCQKQLLQIQLKNTERDKAQLIHELEEERNYAKSLEKEVDNLEKLIDGEKKLNEKLDRELYTLINATKQMKIQLLQEKTKNKQLEQEVFQMEQAISEHHKETTQLQQKITQLQIAQRKVPRLQDQVNELKAKLQISNQKYEQLRKIKHELQEKVEQFEGKIVEIQKKQSQDQLKQQTFQQTIKSQNSSKIKQIEEMSLAIKQKYQKKIQVMEKHYKELKDKCKYYKQENTKLYEGFQIQSKKQAKLQEKYQKTKMRQQQLEDQFSASKENFQLIEEKFKTQILLSKELKRELMNSERSKLYLERKIKKHLVSKLPNLLSQIKLLKDDASTMKSIIQTYKDITRKTGLKNLIEFQSRLNLILTEQKDKFNSLQSEFNQKIILLEHWKKEAQTSEQEKLKLIERLNSFQAKEVAQTQKLEARQSELILLGQRLSLLESANSKLEKQIQSYKKIQKSGLQQLQILREKQKEVEQFYSLVDELTEENNLLKKKLEDVLFKHQEYVTFNKDQNSHNNYFQYNSKNTLPKNNDSLPSYLIPQKQSKQKANSRTNQSITNSHSCVHLRPLSKNKSSMGLMDAPKNPSVQKHNHKYHIKSHYDQTIPNQLPIHSRPIMFDSRKSHTYIEPCQTFPSEEMMDLREQKNVVKYNFENQKHRLEQIKHEYQKMMADKFREEFIEKMNVQKGAY